MLVLQSCSDSLHIQPSLSCETNALSGGVCNFSNTDVEEDVVVIEEMLIFINKEEDGGIKQEDIPGDMAFTDVKSEADEVSYIRICLYRTLHHHYTHYIYWYHNTFLYTVPYTTSPFHPLHILIP